ncbi:hypothetical protein [Glycomyces buryatensis]|uniref:Uncharacterized protein n=1 Tax=Glycomyces buryatensis TaxID=2570927 RepID=A0A4S8Q6U1_9ACTN|nr:hypothetical protein [Glycomyces buryatensis]THV40087.1 hypothetical protein FAB82_16305 [Glycomyces buryatensis]
MTRRNINISDQAWEIASASGNASAFIDQAVKDSYVQQAERAGAAVAAALSPQEVEDWMADVAAVIDQAEGGHR